MVTVDALSSLVAFAMHLAIFNSLSLFLGDLHCIRDTI